MPQPTLDRQISFWTDEATADDIVRAARGWDRSSAYIVRVAIKDWLKRNPPPPAQNGRAA